MTKYLSIFFVILLFTSCNEDEKVEEKVLFSSKKDSLSYSLGMLYASKLPENMKANDLDSISYILFAQGVKDYFDSTANALSDQQIKDYIANAKNKVQKTVNKVDDSKYLVNAEKGKEFLNNNLKSKDVVEFEPGLQYKVNLAGWGKKSPFIHDTVLIYYKVYNTDYMLIYDSKRDSQEPMPIQLDAAVKSWQKILPIVTTGAKVRIYSSHEFAYGNTMSEDKKIEPYSTVIFDIELIKFIRNEKYASDSTNQAQ